MVGPEMKASRNTQADRETKQGWDAKRLVSTLLFFGAIPILSNCSWFARMTGQTGTIAYGA
ncbi:MAG: hypothetical protein AAGJ55_10025, partial [Cyanobacteria bacterium J06555_12]